MWINRNIFCKGVCHPGPTIVLLIYMYMDMHMDMPKVESTWVLACCSHGGGGFAPTWVGVGSVCTCFLPTWFAQSLCWGKRAPAQPDCFIPGFSICSCCFPAIHFGAKRWDPGNDFSHEGVGLGPQEGFYSCLSRQGRKGRTCSGGETLFSRCTDMWSFWFCATWIYTGGGMDLEVII